MSTQSLGAAPIRQHLPLFKHLWEIVEKRFDPTTVLTPAGHAFVQTYAIKGSHPLFPTAMNFISLMPALTNGARAPLFPNGLSPLFSVFLNVNYAQTRKSSLTGTADVVGGELDKIVRERVLAKFADLLAAKEAEEEAEGERHMDANQGGEGGAKGDGKGKGGGKAKGKAKQRSRRVKRTETPEVVSILLHSATPEEFFHRCSGDFQQIANADSIEFDVEGRHWFGVLVNLDEAYDLLLSFGLLSEEAKPASNRSSQRVNPHQSALNKLLQSGQASRATKSCGAYGDGVTATVSGSLLMNMHPEQYVPMERGESGSHTVACKERFLVATGRPVQPHEPLPSDYALPPGASRWRWVPLVPAVAQILGLHAGSVSPEAARSLWAEVALDDETTDVGEGNDGAKEYVPHSAGFAVTLPDGVASRVRFLRDASTQTGFIPEWRISNREFSIPEQHKLETAVKRCADYFEIPHKVLDVAPDARRLNLSYQGAFNVGSHLKREEADMQGGARLGCAPWQLGELAECLLVFDIFVGRYDGTQELKDRTLRATATHVERAASVLSVVHEIKEAVVTWNSAMRPKADLRTASDATDPFWLEQLTAPWSQSLFAAFSASQDVSVAAGGEQAATAAASVGPAAAEAGEEERDDGDAEHASQDGLLGLPPSPTASAPGGAALVEPAADSAAEGAAAALPDLKQLKDVRDRSYGYGPNGASVQHPAHGSLSDRDIVKQTLLGGTPTIKAKDACDRMKIKLGAEAKRKALPQPTWRAVFAAASRETNIFRLDGEGRDLKLLLKPVPTDPLGKVEYHNELMTVCGMELRELVDAMKKAKGKADEKVKRNASAAVAEGAHRSRSRSPR